MTSKISILYDTIRLEEKLLIESAKKNDISIDMVDCKKLFLDLNEKIAWMDQYYKDVLAITGIYIRQQLLKVRVPK